MKAQDDFTRAELAQLPDRAAADRAAEDSCSITTRSAPPRTGRDATSIRASTPTGRRRSSTGARASRVSSEVLFDPNTWSIDGTTGLGGWWPSHDGRYVAFSIKENNSDETVTRIRDVAAETDLPDIIVGTKYSGASWTADGSGFYYTRVPPVGGAVTVAERPGFAEHQIPPPRHEPRRRSAHSRRDAESGNLHRRRDLARRTLADRLDPARMELDRRVHQGRAAAGRAVADAGQRRQRQLRRGRLEGPAVRPHERRCAEIPRLRRRPVRSRSFRMARGHSRGRGDTRQHQHRRPPSWRDLAAQCCHRDRAVHPRWHVRAQGGHSAARNLARSRAAIQTRTRPTSPTRRSPNRRSSTGRRSRPAQ